MKILIVDEGGAKTYDPENGIIVAAYLSGSDKHNLANMHPDASVYSSYDSERFSQEEVLAVIAQFKEDMNRANEQRSRND